MRRSERMPSGPTPGFGCERLLATSVYWREHAAHLPPSHRRLATDLQGEPFSREAIEQPGRRDIFDTAAKHAVALHDAGQDRFSRQRFLGPERTFDHRLG